MDAVHPAIQKVQKKGSAMRKSYVSKLLGLSRRDITTRHPDPEVVEDFAADPAPQLAFRPEPPIYLGDRKLLVQTKWGGHLVVPTYNFDVAIGAARDGVIEPWTTRLIQELVREGDVIINAGANFGYYAVLSAYHAGQRGKVIAIEANPHIIPYLIDSCYWGWCTRPGANI